MQAEARHDLAQSLLWAGDLPAARDTIDTARTHQYPSTRAGIALLDGIIHLRHKETAAAQEAFREAIAQADERIQHNLADYNSLDTKALALAGLTLTGSADHTADAASAFRTARSVTSALGVTTRIHRYLDALTPVDSAGVLFRIRPSAAGYKQ